METSNTFFSNYKPVKNGAELLIYLMFVHMQYRYVYYRVDHLFRPGMSNSNPCAGRSSIFKDKKKLSVGCSFEKFSKFYCLEALLYDNLSKNYLINVILRSNKIAAGRIGQAMGPHAARGPPV